MYTFYQIFKRDVLNLFLNPMWVFYGTAFPFLLVLIFGFLSGGQYGNTITSYDYYGITMMVYIVFNTATIAANSFMEERIKQGNMRVIFAPVPNAYMYVSKITASVIFSTVCHLFVLFLLAILLNVNFGGAHAGYIISILILFEIFASILGVLFCCIFKSENTSNQVLSMMINLTALLGGLFFRLDGFGKTIEAISYLSPVKWIVTSMFHIIYDNNFAYYLPTIVILFVLSIASLLLCWVFYRTEDYV